MVPTAHPERRSADGLLRHRLYLIRYLLHHGHHALLYPDARIDPGLRRAHIPDHVPDELFHHWQPGCLHRPLDDDRRDAPGELSACLHDGGHLRRHLCRPAPDGLLRDTRASGILYSAPGRDR